VAVYDRAVMNWRWVGDPQKKRAGLRQVRDLPRIGVAEPSAYADYVTRFYGKELDSKLSLTIMAVF